ncbi:cation transporter [Rhodanobacter denitrificans]|jgi:Co/Zn/Cd efflux system component|uniref:cation transporter n=1 Tax=Rhodanobacter denitrificans TaxID=666685 RepID=UPI0005BAF514|nr:cation transporter [Rhodanobacter denitrificans]UJM92018.1 cation transporter [Rhodanobacter denitrificans]
MSEWGCHAAASNEAERWILRLALGLNATMFVVGIVAGLIAQSMGLIADSLDMLADACAYGIGLVAWARSAHFKASAAQLSGILLLILGLGVLLGVIWRSVMGSHPEGGWMMAIAFVALIVNATVLRLLGRFRQGEVHLRATWLFTRVDVIANGAVILSGVLVLWLHSPVPDLVIGAAIAVYVLKESVGILREAREARAAATAIAKP